MVRNGRECELVKYVAGPGGLGVEEDADRDEPLGERAVGDAVLRGLAEADCAGSSGRVCQVRSRSGWPEHRGPDSSNGVLESEETERVPGLDLVGRESYFQ